MSGRLLPLDNIVWFRPNKRTGGVLRGTMERIPGVVQYVRKDRVAIKVRNPAGEEVIRTVLRDTVVKVEEMLEL